MKLLRPLAGYTLYDHKTNDSIRRKIQITCILDKIDEYRLNWFLLCILPLLQFRLYIQVCEISTADCGTNDLEHIINSLKSEKRSQHAITMTAN
jgi:hypothetical protein